ncbi:MAG: hypothetical protein ACREFB_00405, partial [Stellaceae bacterium]
LVHVAGHNLGILMRLLIGAGTPKEAAARGLAYLLLVCTGEVMAIVLVAATPDGIAGLTPGHCRRSWLTKQRLQQRPVKASG